jgi:hypothetical protein
MTWFDKIQYEVKNLELSISSNVSKINFKLFSMCKNIDIILNWSLLEALDPEWGDRDTR